MSSRHWIKSALLVLLAGVVSIVALNYVGDVTIYSLHNAALRERSHEQIIDNRAPVGGWTADGANGTNVRVAVPYLVEFVHQESGIRVGQLYKGVDLICTWAGFIVFFLYLRRRFSELESILGCLYLAAVLPLTFAFHSYQPWDRASFVAWVLAIWCVNAARFWSFFAVAVAGVLIKYDAAVLPALYILGNATRQNWRSTLLRSGAALIVLLGLFYALVVLIPGGFEPRHYGPVVMRNLGMMLHSAVFYPPFLAFGLPVLLGFAGYKSSDQFGRASFWFCGLIALVQFVSTNFEEVRGEQMFFPLLAPAALFGLRRLLGQQGASTPDQADVKI